jgi:hypothetical protein
MYTKEEIISVIREAIWAKTDLTITPIMINPEKLDSSIVIGIMQDVEGQPRLRYTITVEDLSPEPIKL